MRLRLDARPELFREKQQELELDSETAPLSCESSAAALQHSQPSFGPGIDWTRFLQATLTIALFVGVLIAPLGFGDAEYKTQQPAQRCLALLVLVAALWGTEIVAVHISALMVPLLVVLMRVLCVP